MPMYEFQCLTCMRKETVFRKIDNRDDDPPECACDGVAYNMQRIVFPHQFVQGDIEPYRAMGPDSPWISSRSEHREYLHKHGYEEVGNDSSWAPSDEDPHPSESAKQYVEDNFKDTKHAPSLDGL